MRWKGIGFANRPVVPAVASRHAVVLPPIGYELFGKAMLGVENNITPLI